MQRSHYTPNAGEPDASENEQRFRGPGSGEVAANVVRHGQAQEAEQGPVADTRPLACPSPIQEHRHPRPENGIQRQRAENLPMAVAILKHQRDLRTQYQPLGRKRHSRQKIPQQQDPERCQQWETEPGWLRGKTNRFKSNEFPYS